MMNVLLPSEAVDWEAHVERLVSSRTLEPFSGSPVDFVDAASKTVLRDSAMRRMPEMMAAAHWMRKAHLLELRKDFERQRGDRIWLPRGVVLHFAPANVDSIFIYSWFISMLLGNANIVRLSNERGVQVEQLLTILNCLASEARFEGIAQRSLILTYPHDDTITRALSEVCNVRVVWGGDDSVDRLRRVPLNPLATEIAFANRFSLAMLNAAAVVAVDDGAATALASRFYNDAYWFDQMACSAPRLVVWVGEAQVCRQAQEIFWAAVSAEVIRRGVHYPEMVGLNKLVSAYGAAASGLVDAIEPGVTGSVSRVHLSSRAGKEFRRIECGGGLFFERDVAEIAELSAVLTARDQTVSYFGFDRETLRRFTSLLPARAVDRIVPIGSALAFGTTWDGSSLFQVFTREIDLQ